MRAALCKCRSSQGLLLLLALIGFVVVGWGLGELCRSTVASPDLEAVRSLAADQTSALTTVAHAFSAMAGGYVITPLAVISFVVLFWRGRRTTAVVIALSTLGAATISTVDKLLVGRPRPPVEHLEAVATASFPSGHSTSGAALYVAVLLALLAVRPRRVVAVAAAAGTGLLLAGIGLSRVYLGVHYPSDVVAGLLLGATWSIVVAAVIRPTRAQNRDDAAKM